MKRRKFLNLLRLENLSRGAKMNIMFQGLAEFRRPFGPPSRSPYRNLKETHELIFSCNHKSYHFLACDWFKNVLFSTNLLAKLLSDSLLLDSLLLDSLLSHSSVSQSHSRMQFKSTNHIQSCNYVCVRACLLWCFCR